MSFFSTALRKQMNLTVASYIIFCTSLLSLVASYIEELEESAKNKKMASYCPHIGLGGANIFIPVTQSSTDSTSTTDSQSSVSGASTIPVVDAISPLPSPSSLSNGPTTPCLQEKEGSVGYQPESYQFQAAAENGGDTFSTGDEMQELLVNGDVSMDGSFTDFAVEVNRLSKGDDRNSAIIITTSNLKGSSQIKTKKRLSTRATCSECDKKTNLWRCLGLDCGLIFCGAKGGNHAQNHFKVRNPELISIKTILKCNFL